MKSKVLVTGGAGYIGAHLVRFLKEQGHFVRVLDDLSSGDFARIENYCDEVIIGSILDIGDLSRATKGIELVYHLAAYKSVENSVHKPLGFFMTNVNGTLNLLKAMAENKVRAIVFASSSAVYGNPYQHSIFREEDIKKPISPYGITKLIGENCLNSICAAEGISSICLRYFNVVGSSYVDISDNSDFNLFPKIVLSSQLESKFEIKGIDYPTLDGTCVRDYVHVADVIEATCRAGELALQVNIHLELNIGSGLGLSVLEIVTEFKKIGNFPFLIENSARRLGDPHTVIADISKSSSMLNWKPQRNLTEIIESVISSSNYKSKIES